MMEFIEPVEFLPRNGRRNPRIVGMQGENLELTSDEAWSIANRINDEIGQREVVLEIDDLEVMAALCRPEALASLRKLYKKREIKPEA